MAKKKSEMDENEVNENSGLFKFSYNGGILMFDIYYKIEKDPKKLITEVKKSMKKTNSEKLLPGIFGLLNDIDTVDNWEYIKKNNIKESEEIKNIEGIDIEKFSDYYLAFVTYNCIKILKNRGECGDYLEKLEEKLRSKEGKKYFPEEAINGMLSTLSGATIKLIREGEETEIKKVLTANLTKIKDIASLKKL